MTGTRNCEPEPAMGAATGAGTGVGAKEDDGMGLVAKRLEHVPNSDPPAVRIISDNQLYSPYERSSEEVHIVGRIRWFAREL